MRLRIDPGWTRAWVQGILLGTLIGQPVWAAGPQTVIKGIDIIGIPAGQAAELLKILGLQEGMQVPYSQLDATVIGPVQDRLRQTGRFQAVSVRPTTFIGGDEDGSTYLTINVVGRNAALGTRAAPQGQIDLPEPIVGFFQERVRGLGAFHDTLPPIDQDRLEGLTEAHADRLIAALKEAADPMVRRRAAQAIAFLPDSRLALQALLSALLDSDPGVRRDASRALQPLLTRNLGRNAIPLEPFFSLIRFPEPADRMNAASLLIKLTKLPENHLPIIREAGGPLLRMARMKHPGERTLAREALQILKQSPAPEDWDVYRTWWEGISGQRFSP